MAKTSFQTKSHRPQMTILIPLFMMPLLLHLSFGFDTSSITCGPFGSDPWCPEGLCCNRDGYCGTTTGFCGEGNCSTQCPASNGQCGLQNDNVGCPNLWSCCSSYGWCGTGSAFCGLHNCTSQCPIGICGKNGGQCPDGSCCNIYGYCGTNDGYCGATCVSQCPTIPPSVGPGPAGPWPWQGPGGPHRDRPYRGPHRKSGGANQLGIEVGISVLAVAILIGCVAIALFMRKRFRDTGFEEEEVPIALEGMPERFSYKQLSVATKGFSEESKLGQGGFGSVYRGVLPSYGIEVAVKRINSDSSQGEKEFMAEVSIISRLRHRNLIQLQGWCKDTARQKYLLVYELMPHGSLDKVLFRRAGSQMAGLSWMRRFNIVKGTAAALDYLHQGWKQQVIHRDIKASNIMLDEEWNAKLGDFGLARLVDHERAGATTMVAGTYGYIAPEAATSGRFTDKTDVFAFGAVVLEIACGRKAFLAEAPPDEMVLVDWVWERLSEGALLSTVDKRLDDYDEYWMEVVLIIGLLCSHPDPAARPSMRLVVEVLGGDVQVPSIPTSKPATVYSSNSETFSIHGPKSGSTYNSRSQDPLLMVRSTSISDYTA